MIHLLDVNALVALAWGKHEHHAKIVAWFDAEPKRVWATCPLTQSAYVRLSMQRSIAGLAASAEEIAHVLAQAIGASTHRFLALDLGFAAVRATCTGGLWGHRQITDGWLLATAVRHGGKLVTFNTGISSLLATATEREKHIALLR